MAQLPTELEVKRIKNAAARKRQRKIASQRKLGKGTDFSHEHGLGVVSEEVWKQIKEGK